MPVRVTDVLELHARERAGALAVADGDIHLSWAQLLSLVDATAASLTAQGLAVGDRVALRAPDGAAALVAALAVLRAGGVHAPVDHTLAQPEVEQLVVELRTPWRIDVARGAAPGALQLQRTAQERAVDPLGEGVSAFVRLSSGTTGAAKGVLLSHGTILARVEAANAGLQLGRDDRVLWLLPMAYHFAVSILLYLQRGAAIVFGNSLRASSTATIARAEQVTFAYGSPYHVRRLAELPTGQDLPRSLRCMVSTTTALDAGAAAAFRARHGMPVRQGLGIIEVGLPFVSPGDADEVPGALGVPLPAYRVAIIDGDGREATTGNDGELAIAGPGLLDAYLSPWRAREAILRDGFFRTGDIAQRDQRGRIRLLGRLKDVINVGGVKVFPLEVEAVLNSHPLVFASRVRAAPDPRLGEQVHAEVQLRAGADERAAVEALAAWCADRLAPLKRPAAIVAATLAQTASGKVRR
jgi:acyl-coenzyme A synthetase/AMP-(fatty) acid ligase